MRVLVLDADNCIFLNDKTGRGSEEVKDEAWYLVYPEYSREQLDAAMKAAKENLSSFAAGKADRQDLVREVCRYFNVPEKQVEDEIVQRCDVFNRVVQKGIREIGISEQTRTVLAELARRMPVYVNTATPLEAVIESLEALGLFSLLKGVYGRPGTKLSNMQDIIELECVDPIEVLFVDDQPTGWAVAQEVGCRFVGIYTARNTAWHETLQPFSIIRSLAELPAFV